MNNTMVFLMKNGVLFYYFLNVVTMKSDIVSGVQGAGSWYGNNSHQSKNSHKVSNYLSPDSILLWNEKTKITPNLIILHPIVFEIILVMNDSVKFHYYNCQRLFECHHVIGLKNCKALSFSPFGDKLILGTVGGILLVDSYTHQTIKHISLVIFPTAPLSLNSNSASKK